MALLLGWRKPNDMHSLPEAYSTVNFPGPDSSWHWKLWAFAGVGFMVSVGYMDPGESVASWKSAAVLLSSVTHSLSKYILPGNWATDLDGGSSFGYTLLIVVLLANFVAMFLQGLCLKLGIVAERDLAQACRCKLFMGSLSIFCQHLLITAALEALQVCVTLTRFQAGMPAGMHTLCGSTILYGYLPKLP